MKRGLFFFQEFDSAPHRKLLIHSLSHISPPGSLHQNPEPRREARDEDERGYGAKRPRYSGHGGPGGRIGRRKWGKGEWGFGI